MTRLSCGLLVQEYSSLDWLSAVSQSNSHWALQQWQSWVMDCLCRSIPQLTICNITEQQPLGITAMTRLSCGLLVQEYSSLDWLSAASQSNSHWALQHRQGQVMVYTLAFLTWLILCSITKQQSLGITPKTRLRLGTHWPWVFLTDYLQNLRAKPLEQGWVRVYV